MPRKAKAMIQSNQTELSTQDLPTLPTVGEMRTWDLEKMLRWIDQRHPNILTGNDLKNFKKQKFYGIAFVSIPSVEIFKKYNLSYGVSVLLMNLVDEVNKAGKFICHGRNSDTS
jgi:hypothetical protein